MHRLPLILLFLLAAWLPRSAAAQGDSISREVMVRRSVFVADAVSREMVVRRSISRIDALSREAVFQILIGSRDAISREVVIELGTKGGDVNSREVVIFRSSGARDVVSREISLNLLGDLTVPDGFLAWEVANVPAGSAEFMAVAVQPSPDPGYLDLFVAATTQQSGAPGDPPDDFLYQVRHHDERIEEVLAFAEADTDPVDLAFGRGGALGPDLFIAARHYDGFALGDQGGAVLRVTPDGQVSTFFDDGTLATAPLGLAVRHPATAGFAEGLTVANGNSAGPSVFALDERGMAGGWTLALGGGLDCVEVGPGSAFGSDLFAGGSDGVIYRVDATGVAMAFSAPLGAAVQGLAFSRGYGFGEWLYALLAHGQVVRLDAAAQVEVFAEGLLIQPLGQDVVRNDLTFTPSGDVLYLTDARRGRIYGIRTEVPTVEDTKTPLRTVLLGNSPNPFNPHTTLRFTVDTLQSIDLTVVDPAGRRVRALVSNREFRAGHHEMTWDGCDDRGRPVASGVYLAVLRAREGISARKMALLK